MLDILEWGDDEIERKTFIGERRHLIERLNKDPDADVDVISD